MLILVLYYVLKNFSRFQFDPFVYEGGFGIGVLNFRFCCVSVRVCAFFSVSVDVAVSINAI
jgi:hypothetical protein